MDLRVLQQEVREYLLAHIHDDAAGFLLSSHPFDIDSKTLAQQLIGLQKSKSKFPELFQNSQVVFPPKVNLEQTSSYTTATYKSSIVQGKTMVDLTGGFGIDVLAFAKAGFKATHIDLSPTLKDYSEQLFTAMNIQVKSVLGDGIDYVYENLDFVDLIYIDPSRKTKANSKAISLHEYEPQITEHVDIMLQKCNCILIKTSPMMDLSQGLKELKSVAEIHIVAVKNEVKELLWLLKSESVDTKVICVNLDTDQSLFGFDWKSKKHNIEYAEPLKYLYEPNASIMKSGGYDEVAMKYDLKKLDGNTHLYTSEKLIPFF